MAAKIIELPMPGDQWQFTIDVVRRPDGTFAARLADARTSLIESGNTDSCSKLQFGPRFGASAPVGPQLWSSFPHRS